LVRACDYAWRMVIDHVVMLVPDAARTTMELRSGYGLGCEESGYLALAGTRGYSVPLTPPAYLEFFVLDLARSVAAAAPGGDQAEAGAIAKIEAALEGTATDSA
jgi:hypothetical protein